MSKKVEFEHGGARANAGRKAQFSEPTKVIRVPESQVDFIKNWLLKNFKNGQLSDLSVYVTDSRIPDMNFYDPEQGPSLKTSLYKIVVND